MAFVRTPRAPVDQPAILDSRNGACVFYRAAGAGRCNLHRSLGHAALPLACRQFPRVSVVDPRGVFVTLSHYCPTAAALLDSPDHVSAAIVCADRTPVAAGERPEDLGLDARQSLPPLLRPGMLADWDSWTRWERHAIDLIEREADSGKALARLRGVVEQLRQWTPDSGPLSLAIDQAFRRSDVVPLSAGSKTAVARAAEVLEAIPSEWRPSRASLAGRRPSTAARRRFLIAHAFANWTSHLGQGLRTWLASIEAADALVEQGCGVREADLLLRHLADPTALAACWSRAEANSRRPA